MKKILTTLVPCLLLTLSATAQGYYDDDIYYDASKAKKEKQEQARQRAVQAARSNYVPSAQPFTDYPAADTYTVNSGSTRDVDEYNRRYSPTQANGVEQTDSVSLDQLLAGDFANTRRIERFSNPDIVTGSDDADLQYYYYNTDAAQPANTTIVINNVDPYGYYGSAWSPWYNGYYSPWYYSSYYSPYWSWGYNPWYYGGLWGPAWVPSWSWSWSWSWGWGGGWHGPGPGYHPSWSWGGSHAWRPSSPGASRPHQQGGVTAGTPGRRPGNSYYGNYAPSSGSGSSSAVIPGSRVNAGRRPSSVNQGNATVNHGNGSSVSGGRGNATVSGSRVNNNNSYNNNYNNSYNNNRNNNSNSNWNAGSRNSGNSSFGSGSRSGGGSFGGGGRSSGGGRSGRH